MIEEIREIEIQILVDTNKRTIEVARKVASLDEIAELVAEVRHQLTC